MTAVQEPLFLPGWEAEPCGDGEPEPAPQRRLRAARLRHMGPTWDYGRSAARSDVTVGRRVDTVIVAGGVL